MKVRYVSFLPKAFRKDLEELLFFHPDQGRFQKTIVESVNRFGVPAIVSHEQTGGLGISIGALGPVQSLFALASEDGTEEHLAGAILFHRAQPELVEILHLVVAPDYLLQGGSSRPAVAIELIETVRAAARRIKGVERVCLHYSRGQPTLLRVR